MENITSALAWAEETLCARRVLPCARGMTASVCASLPPWFLGRRKAQLRTGLTLHPSSEVLPCPSLPFNLYAFALGIHMCLLQPQGCSLYLPVLMRFKY